LFVSLRSEGHCLTRWIKRSIARTQRFLFHLSAPLCWTASHPQAA